MIDLDCMRCFPLQRTFVGVSGIAGAGWGLFIGETAQNHELIAEYVGEVLSQVRGVQSTWSHTRTRASNTVIVGVWRGLAVCGRVAWQEEADRRGTIYDAVNRSYLFNLNADEVVDASHYANKMRVRVIVLGSPRRGCIGLDTVMVVWRRCAPCCDTRCVPGLCSLPTTRPSRTARRE